MSAFLNQLMHINVRRKDAGHILTRVNNLTRANGLRATHHCSTEDWSMRAFAVPTQMKLCGVEEKLVLKRAVADLCRTKSSTDRRAA